MITHLLEISSPSTEVGWQQDRCGILVLSMAIDRVERGADFTDWIVVEHDARGGAISTRRVSFDDPVWRAPTRLTVPDAALRAAADALGETGAAKRIPGNRARSRSTWPADR